MSEIERINITLPKKLVSRSKILIDEGLFSSFSEMVREGIKSLILRDAELIEKKKILKQVLGENEGYDADLRQLSKEQIIDRVRETRDQLWEEKYYKWFK